MTDSFTTYVAYNWADGKTGGACVRDAGTVEDARGKMAQDVTFFTGLGHTITAAEITRSCETCNGRGYIPNRRTPKWEKGKACKACNTVGYFPVEALL